MTAFSFSRFLFSVLSWVLICFSSSLYAEPADPLDMSPGETNQSATTLTQGQVAVMLANRLGLGAGQSSAITEASAIQMLSARGIAPAGGWEANELATIGDIARMLVYALGEQDELSEAELAGEESQPFEDLLLAKYNVDVTQTATGDSFGQNDLDQKLDALVGTTGDTSGNISNSSGSTGEGATDSIPSSGGGGGGGIIGSPSGAAPP